MVKRLSAVVMFLGIAFLAFCESNKEIPDTLKGFSSHLEFLGYTVSTATEKSVSLKHAKYPNERLLIYNGGVLFTSWWGLSAEGKKSKDEVTQLMNNLNMKSVVTKYYLDEDGDMVFEAWYPGAYDKTDVGLFIGKIQSDWDEAVSNFQSELQDYLD